MAKKNKRTEEPAAQEPQLTLLPDQPLVPDSQGMMETNALPVTPFEPYEDLQTSVTKSGVLIPIVLRRDQKGGLRIIDGKRRRAAAAVAGIAEVPTVVYKVEDHVADSYILALHAQRRPNTVAELDALNRLLENVETNRSALARQLGVPLPRVNRLLTLNELVPPLMGAWRDGRFPDSVAFNAAKLDKNGQDALVDVMASQGGVLKSSDVAKRTPKQGKLEVGDTEIDRDTFVSRVKDSIIESDYDLSKASPDQIAEWLARRCFDGATITLRHVMEEVA